MVSRLLAGVLCAVMLLAGCSKSNNLLLGRVEATVAGHTVVVTDCYRTSVPAPQADANGARFTPCRDADVLIRAEQLTVNGTAYGPLSPGARVIVDHGRVSIEK
jgi:major membrane immunogen (membrane-anchored lipoprotein)